jgi:hypothetical protein
MDTRQVRDEWEAQLRELDRIRQRESLDMLMREWAQLQTTIDEILERKAN